MPTSVLADLHAAVLERLGPDAQTLRIERAVLGLFFTGVRLSDGAGGLAATPVKRMPEAVCCPSSAAAMPLPGRIAGRRVVDVLDDLHRPQPLRRALALATLNAAADTLWRRDGPPAGATLHDGDAFAALPIAPSDRVVLVGAFVPYLRALRQRGRPFAVLELDPSTLKPEELPFYVPAERAPQVVPDADVLIVTGTTLLNDTLDALLARVRPGAEVAVVGPTATLLAAPWVRHGVTVVGGARVRAPDETLAMLAEGGSGHHLFGDAVQRVTLRVGQRAALSA